MTTPPDKPKRWWPCQFNARVLAITTSVLGGCYQHAPTVSDHTRQIGVDTRSAPDEAATPEVVKLRAALVDSGVITFLSHNGRWLGADNDLELRLTSDGTANIIEFGYAVTAERGSFELRDDGSILVVPGGGETPWLPMQLSTSDGMLRIERPADDIIRNAALADGIPESEITAEAIEHAWGQWPLRQVANRE